MDPTNERIIQLLKEVLRRNGVGIDPSEHPIAQLGSLMRAINIEFRRIHQVQTPPEVIFLRAELRVLDAFDVFMDDRGKACRIRIPRASLYDEE